MMQRLFIALAVAFLPTQLRAQHASPEDLDLRGSDIFRAMLKQRGVEPAHQFQPGFGPEPQMILVVFGPIHPSRVQIVSSISANLLSLGGAVLIATDRNLDLRQFFEPRGGMPLIDGGSVTDNIANGGEPDTPLLRFGITPAIADADLAAISRMERVICNRPSALRQPVRPQVLVPFGTFSDSAMLAGENRFNLCGMGVLSTDSGVAVVLSDAGILSNQALAPGPGVRSDNYEFALHLSAFLAYGPNRSAKRTRCIFIEGNISQNDFDSVPLTSGVPDFRPSWPMIQKTIAENTESKLNTLQDRDFPTRDLLRQFGFLDILLKIVTALAIVAGLWVLRSAWSGRESMAASEPTARRESLWDTNTLFPPAREKLRLQFLAWGLSEHTPAAVDIRGSYFYRKRMERIVRNFNAIAFGPPRRISRNGWRDLEAQLLKVERACADGTMSLRAVGSHS